MQRDKTRVATFVKPQNASATDESKFPVHLAPWDLALLSANYIQKGLLFEKPSTRSVLTHDPEDFSHDLLQRLKESLSLTLVHFYPLTGRLVTHTNENSHSYCISVDCKDGPGVKLVHAALDMTVSDILSPLNVPLVLRSFFDMNGAVNHDGHALPLFSVQVTDLLDGLFLGCTLNHCLADGTSFWHFFNAWSEIFQQLETNPSVSGMDDIAISVRPIHKRWIPDGYGLPIDLPFKHHNEFIRIYETPPHLVERIFHFSAASLAKLKVKANSEYNTTKISTFQSLSAWVWRCITRARNLSGDQKTRCTLTVNNRGRLEPPLPPSYFGNSMNLLATESTAGELLQRNLGWAAWKVHLLVSNYNDQVIRKNVQLWLQSPTIGTLDQISIPGAVLFGSSHRFEMYGPQFGMGKAVAVRSGPANKYDGKISAYPGREADGSIDLEIMMSPIAMSALAGDDEFMAFVSTH